MFCSKTDTPPVNEANLEVSLQSKFGMAAIPPCSWCKKHYQEADVLQTSKTILLETPSFGTREEKKVRNVCILRCSPPNLRLCAPGADVGWLPEGSVTWEVWNTTQFWASHRDWEQKNFVQLSALCWPIWSQVACTEAQSVECSECSVSCSACVSACSVAASSECSASVESAWSECSSTWALWAWKSWKDFCLFFEQIWNLKKTKKNH